MGTEDGGGSRTETTRTWTGVTMLWGPRAVPALWARRVHLESRQEMQSLPGEWLCRHRTDRCHQNCHPSQVPGSLLGSTGPREHGAARWALTGAPALPCPGSLVTLPGLIPALSQENEALPSCPPALTNSSSTLAA